MKLDVPCHLTAGIFFDLVLEARKRPVANQKDCFRDLLRISDRSTAQVLTGNSLKAISSRFRNCDPDLAGSDYIHFGDPMMAGAFRERICGSYDAVEKEMRSYADRYLDLEINGKWLVRALLELLENDDGIPDDTKLFILPGGKCLQKRDLWKIREIQVYSFLIGIWELICSRKYEADQEGYLALTESCGENRPRRLRKDRIGNAEVHPDLRIELRISPVKEYAPAVPVEMPLQQEFEQSDVRRLKVYLQHVRNRHSMKKTYFYETQRRFYDFFVCNDVWVREVESFEHPDGLYIRDICPDNIPKEHHFIILSGMGGLGKTMMMIHFLLDSIEKSSVNGRIPLYVTLRKFNVDHGSLWEFLLSELCRYDPSLDRDDFVQLLKSGRMILLLDGLDEIRTDWREMFYQELDTLTDSYPDNLFVISSRPSVNFRILSRFVVYDLQPFSCKQAVQMIKNLDKVVVDEEIRNDFIQDLEDGRFRFQYEEYTEFLGNPMLLVILFLTYEGNHSIPTQRYLFYEEAYNALAIKHDAAKALSRPFATNLSSREFKRYFGEFCMLTYYDEKYSFSYDEITGVKHTMATKPMTREHLQEFVDCYCSGHMEDRKETFNAETNPNGRWRRFSEEDVKAREDLNFKWLDFTEEDDRSVADILDEMQDEADGISAAVAQLKELLGGIEF